MLINILFTVLFLSLFYFSGLALLPRRYFDSNPGVEFVFATVCGSSIIFAISGLVVYGNLNLLLLLLIFCGLVIVGFIRMLKNNNKFREFVLNKYLFAMTIPALVFIALNSTGFFSTSIRLRNGPDLVGWLVSSRFLCEGGSLSGLKERVFVGAGSRDLSQIFAHPTSTAFNKDVTIGSIANTADQYSGEFLIGAERLGIPGFQASVCKVLGSESIFSTYVALSAYAILISTLILYFIGLEIGKGRVVSTGYAILGILNVAVFSVVFEGGFGQLISLPTFLLIGISLASKFSVRSRLVFSLFAITVFAISSYKDVIGISLGFLGIYLVLNFPEIFDDWRRTKSRKDPKTLSRFFLEKTGLEDKGPGFRLASLLTVFLVFIFTLGPLLVERLSSRGIVGGWGFGWFPTPGDIVGIVNWIPSDGTSHQNARTGLQILFGFIAILILFFVYLKSSEASKRIQKSIFALYLLFLLIEFTKSSQYWNTYAIWKAGAYLAPIYFGFLVLESRPKKSKHHRISVISIACLFISTLTSFVWWGYDYHRNSIAISPIVPIRISEMIATKDIHFSGVRGVGAGSASLTLLGDVHYLNPGRIGGVPTKRSVPTRELVYLIHRSFCHQDVKIDLSCARGVFGLEPQTKLKISFIEGDLTALSRF
jgi:hypothetical protein